MTLISVPVGVVYHIITLRNTKRNQELQLETRETQLFMSMYNRFQDDFIETYYKIRDFEFNTFARACASLRSKQYASDYNYGRIIILKQECSYYGY